MDVIWLELARIMDLARTGRDHETGRRESASGAGIDPGRSQWPWPGPRRLTDPGSGQWSRPPSTPLPRSVVQAEREGGLGGGLRELVLVGEPAYGGACGQELGRVLAPDVVLHLDGDADDARAPRRRRLGLHPGLGQFAGLVDALGELHHLLVLPDLAQRLQHALVGDVVHAGPRTN